MHTLARSPRNGWTWASSFCTNLTHPHASLAGINKRSFGKQTSGMDADEQLARQLQVCHLAGTVPCLLGILPYASAQSKYKSGQGSVQDGY